MMIWMEPSKVFVHEEKIQDQATRQLARAHQLELLTVTTTRVLNLMFDPLGAFYVHTTI
jgi:DUF1365 family protein